MLEGLGFGLAIGFFFFICFMSFYSDHKNKKQGVRVEMIRARLMLLSTCIKDIEDFLVNKEPYLTKEIIEQLINRVSEIKAEETINKDWASKVRVSSEENLSLVEMREENLAKTKIL